MSLFDTISAGIKEAMLSRDHTRLEALRSIKKEFLEAKTAPGSDSTLSDEQGLKIISKLLKQREDSAQIYRENNRPELAEEDEAQAEVFRSFLPAQMSEEEITTAVKAVIEKLGITDMKGMGQVMGVVTKELAGKAEGKTISSVVRNFLSGK